MTAQENQDDLPPARSILEDPRQDQYMKYVIDKEHFISLEPHDWTGTGLSQRTILHFLSHGLVKRDMNYEEGAHRRPQVPALVSDSAAPA